ncbi:MAG: DUF962 domain-containing protein [Pseudomonadota bacterium]|nr:DUF962 domain-containing protein [Pseudomonadota bacterium]
MAVDPNPLRSYAEFWPFYLRQHSQRLTRLIHVVGSLLAVLLMAQGVLRGSIAWLLIGPAIGYGGAWIAHMLVEKNHPATFKHPLWSLRRDFDLVRLWLTGRLELELVRHNI